MMYGKTSILVAHSWIGCWWKHFLIVWLYLMPSIFWFVLKHWRHQQLCYFLVIVHLFYSGKIAPNPNSNPNPNLEGGAIFREGGFRSPFRVLIRMVRLAFIPNQFWIVFNLTTKFRCFLYFIKPYTDLVLFALVFNLERFIIGFWLPRKIFDFFWAWLLKVSTKFYVR